MRPPCPSKRTLGILEVQFSARHTGKCVLAAGTRCIHLICGIGLQRESAVEKARYITKFDIRFPRLTGVQPEIAAAVAGRAARIELLKLKRTRQRYPKRIVAEQAGLCEADAVGV